MGITLTLSAISALFGLAAITLLRRMAHPLPAADERTPTPRISVIIPARDEEHNLPVLLESLGQQDLADLEVIVADDGSTDGTARIAAELGARVVTVPSRPPGWFGKNWACSCGARASTGDLLVFVDADTRLEQGGLARIVGVLQCREGLVSVEPYHLAVKAHEQLSAMFNIVRLAGVGGGDGPPAGAFGPCLAIRRRDYLDLGGHAHPRVRGQILEHFAMGQVFCRQGGQVHCHRGQGVISFRMYPRGLSELVQGWSKALLDGARGTPKRAMIAVNLWLSGSALSVAALAASLYSPHPWWAAGLAVVALHALLVHLMLRRAGRFSRWVAPLFVVPLLAFIGIFALAAIRSALGRAVTWRGRAIVSPSKPEV